MDKTVTMPLDVATALYHVLLDPKKDPDGNVVYILSLTLATEVRMAIGDQVK